MNGHTPQLPADASGVAVYAGSFDPPTNGHTWMIERSARLFDRLIVAVAQNPEKTYTFELERRLAWLRSISDHLVNVEITHIENQFLAHFARDVGARHVVRGIRNEADYQYERAMRYVNADLHEGLTTVFFIPPRALCELSSSFVKGMIGPKGWEEAVATYVPPVVFKDLKSWAETRVEA
ncbi:MAG: pantetheine-phosphate adenylyltransferase [Phycisphaerae bacterium]|nr:pantetheine-phosphate adenylyltransferase [Phycisphaerae bacterium]